MQGAGAYCGGLSHFLFCLHKKLRFSKAVVTSTIRLQFDRVTIIRRPTLRPYGATEIRLLCPRPDRAEALSDDARLTSVGLSRTERPRKTDIGTEVAYVTRDSDITFEVKRSKVNLQGNSGAYCGGLPHSLFGVELKNST